MALAMVAISGSEFISATITPGAPALLVQFNKNFAPAPGVNSLLIK